MDRKNGLSPNMPTKTRPGTNPATLVAGSLFWPPKFFSSKITHYSPYGPEKWPESEYAH